MKAHGYWDETVVEQLKEEVKEEIDRAVKELETMPPADVNDIYDYMFEKPTWTIEQQKEEYMNHLRGVR